MRATLQKAERLKGHERFSELMRAGHAVSIGPLRLLGRSNADEPGKVRVAFTVPTRAMAKAVDRNRMKRLMREVYRTEKGRVLEAAGSNGVALDLLFIYRAAERCGLEEIRDIMQRALMRWIKEYAGDDR